jgi:SAM-dependent methyltransferase
MIDDERSIAELERLRAVYAARDLRPSNAANPGRQAMLAERNEALRRLLAWDMPLLAMCRVLDIGCGKGDLLAWFHRQRVPSDKLYGIDLRPGAIQAAQTIYPAFHFELGNAEFLPYTGGSFDIVCLFTVLSSILERGMQRRIAEEIERVLAPGGCVVIYDVRYKNPRNPDVRPITPGLIRALFPNFRGRLAATTLAPPIAERLGSLTPMLYPALAAIPLLRSHMIGLLWRR